jgi:hypothetical protein
MAPNTRKPRLGRSLLNPWELSKLKAITISNKPATSTMIQDMPILLYRASK